MSKTLNVSNVETISKRFTQLEQMINHCEEQIKQCGPKTVVVYTIHRRAGGDHIRLFGRAGGPKGRVVQDTGIETTAMFQATEVLGAARKMIGRMIIEWPWLLEVSR